MRMLGDHALQMCRHERNQERRSSALPASMPARTGSVATAEDVVQDLYLKISEMAEPQDLRSPEAFLYRVGSNLMLDRVKQHRRQVARASGSRRRTGGSVGR